MGEQKCSVGVEKLSFTTGISDPSEERGQLTRVGADGDGDDPEEERQCQRGTKHDHVRHHLGVFLDQHLVFRVHPGELEDREHTGSGHHGW